MNSMIQQSMPNQAVLANEMKAIQRNPAKYLLSKNLDVPVDIVNNPQAIINWGLQTGKWTPRRVAQVKQMIGM